MAEFHFVEDYERHVDKLLAGFPLDEAMSLAVGGNYDAFGPVQVDMMVEVGLHGGMALLDLGCGSGRTAKHVGLRFPDINYTGIDVVQRLLDYAATQCPPHFRFLRNRELSWPVENASADFICAFSLFTHLLHEESYLYLNDCCRILRPGGTLLFTFLEFAAAAHWEIFKVSIKTRASAERPPLNTFIEADVVRIWAAHLGLNVTRLTQGSPLGQSLAVLQAPA